MDSQTAKGGSFIFISTPPVLDSRRQLSPPPPLLSQLHCHPALLNDNAQHRCTTHEEEGNGHLWHAPHKPTPLWAFCTKTAQCISSRNYSANQKSTKASHWLGRGLAETCNLSLNPKKKKITHGSTPCWSKHVQHFERLVANAN